LYELFQSIHRAASAVLVGLICVHVAGALKHLVLDRDGVFFRMVPRRSS